MKKPKKRVGLDKAFNYHGLAAELPADDKRLKKFARQRQQRGFDDTETWNLDAVILSFALPRLKRFKEVTNGYPPTFDSMEEWRAVLDKMIKGIEIYISSVHIDTKESDEGLELFFKYFKSLWW